MRLGEEEHALLVTMHHIVSDGWSMGVLVDELSALYRAYRRGQADAACRSCRCSTPTTRPGSGSWMSGEVLEGQAEYWKKTLAGAPALLELPADRPRPAQQDYAGEVVEIELDAGTDGELKALSRRHGTTLYMTLLAGWAALLARLSGQEEVVIGTPVANRRRLGDRGADRLLRQHAGAADGSVGSADGGGVAGAGEGADAGGAAASGHAVRAGGGDCCSRRGVCRTRRSSR